MSSTARMHLGRGAGCKDCAPSNAKKQIRHATGVLRPPFRLLVKCSRHEVLLARDVEASSPTCRGHRVKGMHHLSRSRSHSGLVRSSISVHSLCPSSVTYLEQLHIQNFALIKDQQVTFTPGLNVVTGESGAGKSVLVEALAQVLGALAPSDCVRPPALTATVEASFYMNSYIAAKVRDQLDSLGVPSRAGQQLSSHHRLVIRREIIQHSGGLRSKCYINEMATSLRILKEVACVLVDNNGQHSSLTVRDPATQRALLDNIAGTTEMVKQFNCNFEELREVEEKLRSMEALSDEGKRQKLQRMIDVVRRLKLVEGEERELREQLKRMEVRRSCVEQCGLVRTSLTGGGGAGLLEGLRSVELQVSSMLASEQMHRDMGRGSKAISNHSYEEFEEGEEVTAAEEQREEEAEDDEGVKMMEEAMEQLALAMDHLEMADEQISAYARKYQASQLDYDEIQDRLGRITRLLKQLECRNTEEVLAMVERAEQQLEEYYEMEGLQDQWQRQVEELRTKLMQQALALSKCRRQAASKLKAAVEDCLQDLGMAQSRFDVKIGWEAASLTTSLAFMFTVPEEDARNLGEAPNMMYGLKSGGLDVVEFLLAAGPAEPLRPLAAVASGGESARIMLALKAAPARARGSRAQEPEEVDVGNDAAGSSHVPSLSGLPAVAVPSGPPVLILDELDSGVGSRLGASVGTMLRSMSHGESATSDQIICITHLPQVASCGVNHVKVKKVQSADGRAMTEFQHLTGEDRVAEVSEMLGLGEAAARELMRATEEKVVTHQGVLHELSEKSNPVGPVSSWDQGYLHENSGKGDMRDGEPPSAVSLDPGLECTTSDAGSTPSQIGSNPSQTEGSHQQSKIGSDTREYAMSSHGAASTCRSPSPCEGSGPHSEHSISNGGSSLYRYTEGGQDYTSSSSTLGRGEAQSAELIPGVAQGGCNAAEDRLPEYPDSSEDGDVIMGHVSEEKGEFVNAQVWSGSPGGRRLGGDG